MEVFHMHTASRFQLAHPQQLPAQLTGATVPPTQGTWCLSITEQEGQAHRSAKHPHLRGYSTQEV